MSKEIEQEGLSIKVPLITEEEINHIDNNMETIVNTFTKQIIRDKELAIVQHIMQRLLEKNEMYRIKIEELMKLKKDHSYSVDVVRQNTKLRYELFNSISKEKVVEKIGARKHIIEEYKKKWAHKDEKYYKAETEFNLLEELLKDEGE